MRRILCLCAVLTACDLPSGSLPPSITVFGTAAYTPHTTHPLRLLVLAADGAPVATTVNVVLDTAALRLGLQLGSPGEVPARDSIAVTSDATGIATMLVSYSSRAGRATLLLHAPSIGARSQVTLTFHGGDASRIDLEPLLPLPVGQVVVVPWTTRDSGFNRVFGEPVLDVVNTSIARMLDESRVIGLSPGQTYVRGVLGNARDSILLTVIP